MNNNSDKKEKSKNRKIIPAVTSALSLFGIISTLIFAALFILKSQDGFFRGGMLISFSAFIFFLLVSFAVRLCYSLRRTIYSYKNILYVGGILYLSLQLLYLGIYIINGYLTGGGISTKAFIRIIADFPRLFSYIALPFLAIICISVSVSNLSLIRHEEFRVTNLLGFFIGVFYLGGTAVLYAASEIVYSHFLAPFGIDGGFVYVTVGTVLPLFFILLLCYFECFFIGCIIMGYVAVKHIPDYDKDFIIILGCSISKKGGLLPLLKGRTNRAVRFAWEQEIATGKKLCYVPSGGQGADEVISEGSAIELYLLSHGAEANEVYPEKKSTDTFENMKLSKAVIDNLKADAKIAFATTNYHVLRSGMLARRAGFDAEGIASKTKWYFWPNGFIREFIAILSMNKKIHIAAIALDLIFSFGVEALMLLGVIA